MGFWFKVFVIIALMVAVDQLRINSTPKPKVQDCDIVEGNWDNCWSLIKR